MYYKIIRLKPEIEQFFYNIRIIDKDYVDILSKNKMFFSPALKFLINAQTNPIPGKNDPHEGLFARVIDKTNKCIEIQNFLYTIFKPDNIYEKHIGVYREFYIIPHLCYFIACCCSPDVTYSKNENGKICATGELSNQYFMDFSNKTNAKCEVKLQNYYTINYDYGHCLSSPKKIKNKNLNYDLLVIKKVEYVDLNGEWILPEYINNTYDGLPYELFYKDKSIAYQQEQRIVNIPLNIYKQIACKFVKEADNDILNDSFYYPLENNGCSYSNNIDKQCIDENNTIISDYLKKSLVLTFPFECMEIVPLKTDSIYFDKLKIVFEVNTYKKPKE